MKYIKDNVFGFFHLKASVVPDAVFHGWFAVYFIKILQ